MTWQILEKNAADAMSFFAGSGVSTLDEVQGGLNSKQSMFRLVYREPAAGEGVPLKLLDLEWDQGWLRTLQNELDDGAFKALCFNAQDQLWALIDESKIPQPALHEIEKRSVS